MTSAILDTNVLVQAVISPPRSASVRALKAYRDRKYQLVFSAETLDELHAVLLIPKIQARHGWSHEDIGQHFVFLLANALFYQAPSDVPADLTRDLTDTKFLALAKASRARYLVTNDRRHLLPLGRYHDTRIVTPAQFLRSLH